MEYKMSKLPYPTPHIAATPDDFAKTVLMPGDPLRSEFIAKNFLTDARLVNNIRGVQGYTGLYKGVRVSVMASGMGMPSIGIYSYELYNFFGVENIIRVGSAGSLLPNVHIRDVVFGMAASANSSYVDTFDFPGRYAPVASFELLRSGVEEAERMGVRHHVGNLYSSDLFYADMKDVNERCAKMGVMAVEMEAAVLYANAARAGKNALAICTISDSLVTGEATSPEERQSTFTQMMEIALEVARKADKN